MQKIRFPSGQKARGGLFGLAPEKALRTAGILTGCGVALTIAAPKIVAVLMALSIVLPAAWYIHRNQAWPRIALSPALLALLAFDAYLACNAVWSADRVTAYLTVWRFLLYSLVLIATLDLLGRSDPALLARMVRGFLFAFAIMAVILLIEVTTGMVLRRTLLSLVPLLRGKDTDIIVENGWVVSISVFMTSRNVAILCFLFWPAMLALRALIDTPLGRASGAAVIAVVAAAVALSTHASSKVAMVASALVFAGACINLDWVRRFVVAGWMAIIVLIVPMGLAGLHWKMHDGTGLFMSAQHRVLIWGVTASRVLVHPIGGIGVSSTASYDETATEQVQRDPASGLPLATNVHAHNVYLQVWYELGLIGAVLLLLTGLPLFQWIASSRAAEQPYLLAAFVLAAVMASFSYSFTDPWFLGAFGFSAVFSRLAYETSLRPDVQDLARQPSASRVAGSA